MRRPQLPTVLAVWVSAAVVLAGVTAGAAAPAVKAHSWTRKGLGAVTQPAPVGDKFVFYAHHGGSLDVVALNARDGSTAWTASASPSDVTAGQPAVLAVRGGMVFYLGYYVGTLSTAQLVARDVASGNVVWRSAAGTFASWPEICPDEPSAVCVNGALPALGAGVLHFDAATGKALTTVKMGTAAYPGRELGLGLFDPGTRSPEVMIATSRDRVAWRRPLSQIFTLPRASSDGGWNVDRIDRLGLYVGSIGISPTIVGGKATSNFADTMTAGFSTKTGRVKWRTVGSYECTALPCPGGAEAGYSSPGNSTGPSVGLRGVAKGTGTYTIATGATHISADASITLQGFDPASGKTAWSFDVGRDLALISDETALPRTGESTIVVQNGSRQLVTLNLRTGASSPVASSAPAWCQRAITYKLSNTAYYPGKIGEYIGQGGLFPCTAGGARRTTTAKIPAFVGRIGATADGVIAWSDTNAVHAQPAS